MAKKVRGAINKIKLYLENLNSNISRDYVLKIIAGESFNIEVEGNIYKLLPEDIKYQIKVSEGFEGKEVEGYQILLNTEISEGLKQEGYVRDVIRRIQTMRKEMNLKYTQQIKLELKCDEFGSTSIINFKEFLMEETITKEISFNQPEKGHIKEWDFDRYKVVIGIQKC
ncbi:hypothetical protein ES705_50762 [subsurface metagenome]